MRPPALFRERPRDRFGKFRSTNLGNGHHARGQDRTHLPILFPELSNTTSTPIEIIGYRWAGIPTGVTVGAVHVYSADESDGLVLGCDDSDDNNMHLSHWHDYAHEPLRIGPHKESARYAMISFTVHAAPTGAFSGCVITYRQEDRLYSQTLHCHEIATPRATADTS